MNRLFAALLLAAWACGAEPPGPVAGDGSAGAGGATQQGQGGSAGSGGVGGSAAGGSGGGGGARDAGSVPDLRADRSVAEAGRADMKPLDPGQCRSNADCPQTHFCTAVPPTTCLKSETLCQRGADVYCDDYGFCVMKSSSCPATSVPVCGCDNKTYQNVCLARQAGTREQDAARCK